MFYVGQKVVCVDDTPRISHAGNWISVGEVYIIRGLYKNTEDNIVLVGVLLEEIVTGETHLCGREKGFYADRFRPVIEKKTDIEWAHELCRNPPTPAKTPVGVV